MLSLLDSPFVISEPNPLCTWMCMCFMQSFPRSICNVVWVLLVVLTVCKTCPCFSSLLVAHMPCIHNDSLSPQCSYGFPALQGYCHVAWFCALNVSSVDLALSLLFAWQMPAQPASPERVGCLRHDSRTSEQAASQTDAEDLALPSAFGKKSANVNLTFNSYAAFREQTKWLGILAAY